MDKNIKFYEFLNILVENENMTNDPLLKNLVTLKDYEELLYPTFLLTKKYPQASFLELKNYLYKTSNIEKIIKDFVYHKGLTPGLVLFFKTPYTFDKIKSGLKEEYKFLNNRKIYNPEPVEYDTIFDLASTSKIFTMIAILKLNEEKRLDLFDVISKYAPEFKYLNNVTIYDLLKFKVHIKTQKRIDEALNPQEALDILYTAYVYPNQEFYNNYTDIGAMVLKCVVEKITKMPFNDYVKETIFKPLNMTDTFLYVPEEKISRLASENFSMKINSKGSLVIKNDTLPGIVHDSKAQAMGSINNNAPGHAGYFSTAHDMLTLGEALTNYTLLNKDSVFSISENIVGKKMGDSYSYYYGSLVYAKQPIPGKLEVYNKLSGPSFMSPGYAGTSLYVDPINKITLFLASNRLHNRIYEINCKTPNIYTNNEGKTFYILPNKTKEIVSLNYTRKKEILIRKALDLALEYKLLEYLYPAKELKRVKKKYLKL